MVRAICMAMARKKLPKQRRKNHLLRILVSPTENRAWTAEAKRSNDGIVAAFVRDRVNGTLGQDPGRLDLDRPPSDPHLWVSRELAERIAASGRTASQLINDALDREEATRAMAPVPPLMGNNAPESTESEGPT